MEAHILQWVVCGVIFWTAAFVVVRKALPGRSFDFCNRVVSTVHAIIAVALATLSVEDWSHPISPLDAPSSASQMMALSVSLSYLIYDSFCCLFDKNVHISNLVHHAVGITGIAASLSYDMCGTEMVTAIWLTEVSSPFLHMRQFLKELDIKDSELSRAADLLFALTFSLARMGCGPYLTSITLTSNYPFVIKAMAVGLQLVSAFWFFKIVRMVRGKVLKRPKVVKVSAD